MKIKIIEERDKLALEDSVNNFLSNYSSTEILDIKYSYWATQTEYGANYSAMIIFR